MIIGLDHLTLSANEFDSGIAFLEEVGFKVRFVNKDLLNHKFKKNYLREYSSLHDVVYLDGIAGGPAIEVIVHGKKDLDSNQEIQQNIFMSGNISSYSESIDSNEARILKAWKPDCEQICGVDFGSFGISAYGIDNSMVAGAKVYCSTLKVTQLDPALKFWVDMLGFKMVDEIRNTDDIRWAELVFPSGIAAWRLNLLIIEWPNNFPMSYLDDRGFTSFCFISTNISRDRDNLNAYPGVTMSDIFKLNPGRNLLDVCVGRGPNNELVELIQVNNENSGKEKSSAI